MRYAIAIIAVMLALPGSAAANTPPSGPLCDSAGTCFTPMPTDRYEAIVVDADGKGWGYLHTSTGHHSLQTTGCTYVWQSEQQWIDYGRPSGPTTCVYVGGYYVTHSYRRFAFPDIPASDFQYFTPNMWVQHTEMKSGGEVVRTMTSIQQGGSQVDAYCRHFASGSGDRVGVDQTPDSVMAACGFTRRASDTVPQTVKPPVTSTAQTIAVPRTAARCGSVGRVTVRSTRVVCRSARFIIARYARTLRSPRGWSCTAIVNDRGRRARCVRRTVARSTVARATIYGIWRPSRR